MSNPVITPTVGRVVLYSLSEQDVGEISRRRTTGHSIAERIREAAWPIGAQAHIGNDVRVGDVFPGIVVRTWGGDCINIQVLLDGNDVLWVTSRNVADEPTPGRHHWMPYQKGQAAKTEQMEKQLAESAGTAGPSADEVSALKKLLSSGQFVEAEVQAKKMTAPRVTPADVEAEIVSEHYFIASDAMDDARSVHVVPVGSGWYLGRTQVLTFCVLQLSNGFVVTGDSAPADSANFDAEAGRKVARANAIDKVWPLLGFRLRDQLSAS